MWILKIKSIRTRGPCWERWRDCVIIEIKSKEGVICLTLDRACCMELKQFLPVLLAMKWPFASSKHRIQGQSGKLYDWASRMASWNIPTQKWWWSSCPRLRMVIWKYRKRRTEANNNMVYLLFYQQEVILPQSNKLVKILEYSLTVTTASCSDEWCASGFHERMGKK